MRLGIMVRTYQLIFYIVFLCFGFHPNFAFGNEAPQVSGVFGMVRYQDLIQGLSYLEKIQTQNKNLDQAETESLRKIFQSKIWSAVIKDSQRLYEVENLVRKLVLNSSNLEKDFEIFQRVGLDDVPDKYFDQIMSKTLPTGPGEKPKTSSLFLLSREPLKSFQLGLGAGRTAQELNLKYLFHHVSSNSDTLTSLTRSADGRPNALISSARDPQRKSRGIGQSTLIGPGFYTSVVSTLNNLDQMGVGLTLDPMAREGSDFSLTKMSEGTYYLRVLNKNAVRIVKTYYGKMTCSGLLSLN